MRSRLVAAAIVVALAGAATAQQPPPPKPPAPPTPEGAKAQSRARQDRQDRSQPVTVDADKMERFGKESLVIFTGNVVARQANSVQYAERMEVYLDEKGDKILRTVSMGSVRIITNDCRTGTAQRAEFSDLEQRVLLIGNARVWQEDNVVSGDKITIFLNQDRTIVESGKQDRVKGIFYPRDDNRDGQPRKTAQPCVN